MKIVLGIDIGGTSIKGASVMENGVIVVPPKDSKEVLR